MRTPYEIIKNKIEMCEETNVELVQKFAIIEIYNGKIIAKHIFDNEEEAFQCYALLYDYKKDQSDYLTNDVFLTIYFEKHLYC